jgi:hypothetical protein
MIKALFLITALLLPGLAYGAYPSVPFSDQVVPARPDPSIACDVGPNAPSIPTLAQRANFTHCALNADFTQVGGYFATLSNYIDACGGPTGNTNGWNGFSWRNWNQNIGPCDGTHIQIQSDPLGSGQVLRMTYPRADTDAYLTCSGNTWDPNGCPNWIYLLEYPQQGNRLPYELYYKIVFYMPSSSFTTSGADTLPFVPLWLQSSSPNSISVAPINFEIHSNMSFQDGDGCNTSNNLCGSGFAQNSVVGPAGNGAGTGTANWSSGYHTTEFLITSDEVSSINMCSYVDGQLAYCWVDTGANNIFGQGGNLVVGHNEWAINMIGRALCFGNQGCQLNDMNVYVKSIQLFSCANFRTQTCPGPLIQADNSRPKHYAQQPLTPQTLVNHTVAWLEGQVLALVAPAHAAEVH